jgi:DNA polymerase-3 subunit alpha
MNLAYKNPTLFWNCACLISNSGSLEDKGTTDYNKMAKALGNIISAGINISLIDINKSKASFEPNVEDNKILFGLKALSGINSETIEKIEQGRPYSGIVDFMRRCPLTKTTMISLIKAGAFDELDNHWASEINKKEPRKVIMAYYISKVSEPKTRITLQNFNGLIQRGLSPEELSPVVKVFSFNKFLKEHMKYKTYYIFNSTCLKYYSDNFSQEKIEIVNGNPCILQTEWDKIYQNEMNKAREWISNNQAEILKNLNMSLFKESWDKYASGSISHWEMESVCFYYHEHELINVNNKKYGIVDFSSLSADSEVEKTFRKNGRSIPIFKLSKIAGTVISKDDNHSTVTLLTTTGVVDVKFSKEYYANYNKQISEKNDDGTKSVVEKSWFKRGEKLLITGFRRDEQFVAKTYAATIGHQLYKITDINEETGDITVIHERAEVA